MPTVAAMSTRLPAEVMTLDSAIAGATGASRAASRLAALIPTCRSTGLPLRSVGEYSTRGVPHGRRGPRSASRLVAGLKPCPTGNQPPYFCAVLGLELPEGLGAPSARRSTPTSVHALPARRKYTSTGWLQAGCRESGAVSATFRYAPSAAGSPGTPAGASSEAVFDVGSPITRCVAPASLSNSNHAAR